MNLTINNKYRQLDEEIIVLLVARLDQAHFFKGVSVLLQALTELPKFVKAIIVGEGDLLNIYQNLAELLNLQDRVFFPGRVSAEALPQYYRMATVTVLPSTTMGEAFGLVLVESLSCGTPVIASDLPGVRTVVDNNTDGFLVIPNNIPDLRSKISKMIALPDEQRLSMGKKGREKVISKYTWEKAGEKLVNIYEQVLSDKKI